MVLVDPDAVNNGGSANSTSSAVRVKQPKRILHFSDGVLEEYSTDEEEVDGLQKDQTVVDPVCITALLCRYCIAHCLAFII